MAKVKIKCISCGISREITRACLKLVKRCKECQTEFNRDKARNRYRKLKGIPIDAPVGVVVKKKKTKKVEIEVKEEKKPEIIPSVTPEEAKKRRKIISKLFDLIEDKSTINDWVHPDHPDWVKET